MSAANGGMAARRAVIRWAARLFRREWRQQILVLALLTFSVAAATLGATAGYNIAPSRDAEFGSASYRMRLFRGDPAAMAERVTAVRAVVGTVEVVPHAFASVPGTTESVDVRAQDPRGPFGRPMLRLRSGHYPQGTAEVALTDRAASLFDTRLGATVTLGGRPRPVVGIVENPGNLRDEFILEAPRPVARGESVTLFMQPTEEQLSRIDGARPNSVFVDRAGLSTEFSPRRSTDKTAVAAIVLMMAAIVLLLVALVAAAGFVVIAQRRLRQLGMMAAVGATDRHLRLVVVANGVAVGAFAAIAGLALALASWLVLSPRLENTAGHRIDPFDVPLWVLGAGALLAVLTAAAAAWWPARAMSKVPITQALSARPPRPTPAHRSVVLAIALIAVGFALVAGGVDVVHDKARPIYLIPGTLLIAFGVLFASPLAIRALAGTARRLPVAGRLALRDLARHQARSGAALAAISLGVGIAVATVVLATASQNSAAEGNLSNRQLLFRFSTDEQGLTDHPPAAVAASRADVDRVAAALPGARVVQLDAAVDLAVDPSSEFVKGPTLPANKPVARQPITLGRPLASEVGSDGQVRHGYRFVALLYVATPDVLRYLGVAPSQVVPTTDVLTVHAATADLRMLDFGNPNAPDRGAPVATTQAVDVPQYRSVPNSLLTAAGMDRHHWTAAPVGWLVESGRALTDAQQRNARRVAIGAGLTVETREQQAALATTRTIATGAGALLALGILAMTVGLIRGEAANDLRTLTAAGATSRMRRNLTGATAGALAFLGALLGIAGAYIALTAGFLDQLSRLDSIPVRHLAVTAFGLPLFAALVGWLVAGREPPTLARQPLLE